MTSRRSGRRIALLLPRPGQPLTLVLPFLLWGTQAMPTAWLRRQVDLLRAWEALATPAP